MRDQIIAEIKYLKDELSSLAPWKAKGDVEKAWWKKHFADSVQVVRERYGKIDTFRPEALLFLAQLQGEEKAAQKELDELGRLDDYEKEVDKRLRLCIDELKSLEQSHEDVPTIVSDKIILEE